MSSRSATLFVILVWTGMLVWAHVYIGTWAERFPIGDETALWGLLSPMGEFTWRKLLDPHNEHFIPLPKLLHYALYRITGDLRPAMFLQAEILGAIALAMILVARRIRGRTEWTDAVFPLLLQHTGNAANLLNGFQLALTLPTALACGILASAAISPDLPRLRRALCAGLGLVALPLCGGAGLAQAPALAAWLGWLGWRGVRSPEPAHRSGGRILIASVLACVAVGVANALLVHAARPAVPRAPIGFVLQHAAALLSLGIGPAASTLWPSSAWLSLSLCAVTIGMLVRGLGREPRERTRRLGILASMTGIACIAIGTGWLRGRSGWQGGFALRYVTLAAPLFCAFYLAWTAYGGRLLGACVRTVLFLVLVAALPINARVGDRYGREQRSHAEDLANLIRGDARTNEILGCYSRHFYVGLLRSRRTLRVLAEQRRAPFDQGPDFPAERFDFPPLDRVPSSIEAETPTQLGLRAGSVALLVRGGTRIHLPLRPGDSRISARFELPARLVDPPLASGMRVLIQLAPAQGPLRTLYQRDLDPVERESDRGAQKVDLELPPGQEGEVLLCTETVIDGRVDRSWLYWTDVAID